MKILLPSCFIAFKLIGTFIDFMLSLANSSIKEDIDVAAAKAVLDLFELYGNSTIEVSKISKGTNIMKNILGKTTIESFSFRTCVNPLLSKNELGQTKIVYESLTTKFVDSDEGLPCVNRIEKAYLGLLITVFLLGMFSLFRLSYFKAELRGIFDPRLRWFGIKPIEEIESEKINGIYGKNCGCKFDSTSNFNCSCQWKKKITLAEHVSFQKLRVVSKLDFDYYITTKTTAD